jgi:hypothetical protein
MPAAALALLVGRATLLALPEAEAGRLAWVAAFF